MTKKFCHSIAFLLLILSQVSAEEGFPLAAKRILFLGDSITNAGHYIADIETQLRIANPDRQPPELLNLGLPSETCSGLSEPDHPFPRPDVHERLDRALKKTKPDVVVACYGMNDGIYFPFRQDRFQKFQQGIEKLIEKVHAADAKIVLVTPPPFDAHPLKNKQGKLLPSGAEKYAWFAVYEDYDKDVMRKYADWVLGQTDKADMVIDVYQPMTDFLAEKRREEPAFFVAADGVHMDEVGHSVLAKAILNAWGVKNWSSPPDGLRDAVGKKQLMLHNAWLSHVGHKRPGVKAGLPMKEALEKAKKLDSEIVELTKTESTER